MKDHAVLKMYQRLDGDTSIPNWQDFIRDKSIVRETVNAEVDHVLKDLNLRVWVTKEYKPEESAWTAAEQAAGLDRTYRLVFQQESELPEDLVDRLLHLPSVEMASRLSVGAARLPQPEISTQTSVALPDIGDLIYLKYAQSLTRGDRGVRIAVLDTGLNLSHKELQGKVGASADFVDLEGLNTSDFIGDVSGYDDVPEDEVGHGTHVSGIVGGKGIEMNEGVAPGCTIMAVRVLATMKSGSKLVGAGIIDNINAGIKWATDNGADVINMSLGIKHTGGGLPHEDVIRYALSKNVTVVAASGNDGTAERYYPGALPGVIAVGAVDQTGAVAPFNSYGANITVVAPGVNIYSSYARNTYAFASGTSQASPFVCGMVGLMKSYARQMGRALKTGDIRTILRDTSDRVDTRLRTEHAGYGLINMADAFKLLAYELA